MTSGGAYNCSSTQLWCSGSPEAQRLNAFAVEIYSSTLTVLPGVLENAVETSHFAHSPTSVRAPESRFTLSWQASFYTELDLARVKL